ncbi:MAG TPA: T9SS type A sorting domain-containing protein, partial [Candidatus Cloacimonadota bacterium]|nr:T9SS type A sorting domain-containing protein [Candidatus Cloacimonadota bacterium]
AGAFSYTLSSGNLNMTWLAPENTEYPVEGYEVYRRYGAGLYEMVDQVATNSYSSLLVNPGTYHFYVQTLYAAGSSLPNPAIAFSFAGVNSDDPHNQPLSTRLNGNYPNPFNPSTNISFSLATPGKVRLSIYNLRGQLVRRLLDKELGSGNHSLIWDGHDESRRAVASGIYLYRLETAKYQETKRMIMMK